jgi:regulator of replication initiation timing
MTRGRHRSSTVVRALPPVTVASLATAGLALAVLNGSLQILRLAVVASWLVALAMAGWTARRGRRFDRESALQESMRRRDESVFTEQLTLLQQSINGLRAQLDELSTDASALRREVVTLRADKAEGEEILRRARAERARAALAQREASDQRLLTAAAFEAAAAVLENFGKTSAADEDPEWLTTWIANLGERGELDLTMHDDTIALDVEGAMELSA